MSHTQPEMRLPQAWNSLPQDEQLAALNWQVLLASRSGVANVPSPKKPTPEPDSSVPWGPQDGDAL